MFNTLLLNATYECIAFIDIRKVLKFLCTHKVEVLAEWDYKVIWTSGCIKLPAIVRLKRRVDFHLRKLKFSKRNVFLRDKGKCQYCNTSLMLNNFTIDHIVPKSRLGATHWTNCVLACKKCNYKKSNFLLNETNMELTRMPSVPKVHVKHDLLLINKRHSHWKFYINY